MDSDDEFEIDAPKRTAREGLKLSKALNIRDMIENGGGSFSFDGQNMDVLEDSDEEVLAYKTKGRKKPCQKFSAKELQDELYKDFLEQDLKGLQLSKKTADFQPVTFDEIASVMKDITPEGGVPGGLKKRVLFPGWGGKIKVGQIAYVNYYITYEKGDETMRSEHIVDASKIPNKHCEPYRFKVGAGEVLAAIDIGVQTMEVKECAQFLSRHEFAYKKLGLLGEVPPETTVLIEMTVVRVEDGSAKPKIWDLPFEERKNLAFDERMKAVNELKTYGKDHVDKQDWRSAQTKYKKAILLLDELYTAVKSEQEMCRELEFILKINIGFCKIKEGEYRRAKYYIEDAIKLEIPNTKKVKGYFRLAQCQTELGEITGARKSIDQARMINSTNPEIDNLYKKLHEKVKKDGETELNYTRRMFSNMTVGTTMDKKQLEQKEETNLQN